MASINKVILIGNLGADPEIRVTSSGESVCNLRLATTDKWTDKSTSDVRESTEWHRVVLYRRLAEIARDFLKKGSQIYIEGRLRTRKWRDKDGRERYTTEVEGNDIQMLGIKALSSMVEPEIVSLPVTQPDQPPADVTPLLRTGMYGGFQNDDDDVPF